MLSGVTQVAGHSPYERYHLDDSLRARIEASGLHLIDPCYQVRTGKRVREAGFRYAVIEDGQVEVFDETRPPKGTSA